MDKKSAIRIFGKSIIWDPTPPAKMILKSLHEFRVGPGREVAAVGGAYSAGAEHSAGP